jgi:hypothetical protein
MYIRDLTSPFFKRFFSILAKLARNQRLHSPIVPFPRNLKMAPDQAEDMLPAELAGDAPGFLPIIDRDKVWAALSLASSPNSYDSSNSRVSCIGFYSIGYRAGISSSTMKTTQLTVMSSWPPFKKARARRPRLSPPRYPARVTYLETLLLLPRSIAQENTRTAPVMPASTRLTIGTRPALVLSARATSPIFVVERRPQGKMELTTRKPRQT